MGYSMKAWKEAATAAPSKPKPKKAAATKKAAKPKATEGSDADE